MAAESADRPRLASLCHTSHSSPLSAAREETLLDLSWANKPPPQRKQEAAQEERAEDGCTKNCRLPAGTCFLLLLSVAGNTVLCVFLAAGHHHRRLCSVSSCDKDDDCSLVSSSRHAFDIRSIPLSHILPQKESASSLRLVSHPPYDG